MSGRFAGGIAAVIALLVLASPAAAQDGAGGAQQTLRQCLGDTNRLQVVFLIDESQSLESSDPDDLRVAGIRAALSGLADLTRSGTGARRPVIDVLFAGFAGVVAPDPFKEDANVTWRPLDERTVDDLQQTADGYARRNKGHNTDYLAALRAARELLNSRVAALTREGGPAPCRLLIWFTDGRWEVSGQPDAAEAGFGEFCGSGGVRDGLAEDGVVLLTVGLRSKTLDQGGAAQLRAYTEGSAPGARDCGESVTPATGLFRSAQDSSRLFLELGDLLSPQPPPPTPDVCAVRCPVEFEVVPGVTRVVLRAATGASGVVMDLAGPVGSPVPLKPGAPASFRVAGAKVTQAWESSTTVEIVATITGDESAGTWSFAFLDPDGRHEDARPDYRLQLLADLSPAAREGTTLVRGETTPVRFGVVDPEGKPVTSGPLIDKARMTVTYTDPATKVSGRAEVTPLGDGRFAAAIPVAPDSVASEISVDADLQFAHDEGQVEIVPQHWSRSLRVALPPSAGFPEVRPTELNLPSVEDEGSASRALVVRGSRIGGGCVWFGRPEVSLPGDDGQLTLSVEGGHTSRGRCLRVERGQRLDIPVTASVREAFTGRATATVPVFQSSDRAPDRTEQLDIGVVVQAAKSPNETVLYLVFVALAVLAVLIPIAILLGLNWWTGRFTPKQHVRARGLTVRVREDGAIAAVVDGGEREPGVRRRDFDLLSTEPGEQRERKITVDEGFRFTAISNFGPRGIKGPLLGPYGLVSVPGKRVIGGTDTPSRRYGDAVEVPLALPGTWLFFPTKTTSGDGDAMIEGRLLLLASGRKQEGEELLANARQAILQMLITRGTGHPNSGGRPSGLRRLVTRLRPNRGQAPPPPPSPPRPSSFLRD